MSCHPEQGWTSPEEQLFAEVNSGPQRRLGEAEAGQSAVGRRAMMGVRGQQHGLEMRFVTDLVEVGVQPVLEPHRQPGNWLTNALATIMRLLTFLLTQRFKSLS
jgi:hypothetical protein